MRSVKDVPKRARNGIVQRIEATIAKYGLDATRLIAGKVFKKHLDKRSLEQSIKAKERELEALKKKA